MAERTYPGAVHINLPGVAAIILGLDMLVFKQEIILRDGVAEYTDIRRTEPGMAVQQVEVVLNVTLIG
jgi:hypothetical protein